MHATLTRAGTSLCAGVVAAALIAVGGDVGMHLGTETAESQAISVHQVALTSVAIPQSDVAALPAVRLDPGNRFSDYVTCITGAGVPGGIALFIASFPPSWNALSKLGASGGVVNGRYVPGLLKYINKVKSACRRFIRS